MGNGGAQSQTSAAPVTEVEVADAARLDAARLRPISTACGMGTTVGVAAHTMLIGRNRAASSESEHRGGVRCTGSFSAPKLRHFRLCPARCAHSLHVHMCCARAAAPGPQLNDRLLNALHIGSNQSSTITPTEME